jgi:UDP-N-acetylglucosamine transferase subunit ALG13
MQERYSIFASIGNARNPFDRFLRMVDEAAGRTGLSAFIQTGFSTYRPEHAASSDFVTRPEFDALLRDAEYVITHAGAGSVMGAVRLGKLPVVVPRRKAFGEMVNDHQLQLANELSAMGWCRVVSDVEELVRILQMPPAAVPLDGNVTNQRMQELVTDFIR